MHDQELVQDSLSSSSSSSSSSNEAHALSALGLDDAIENHLHTWRIHRPDAADAMLARVVCEHRDRYALATASGDVLGTVSGRVRREARARDDLPAVGDWVVARVACQEGSESEPLLARSGEASIVHVLPRRSVLARRAAGSRTEAQIVAANLDLVLVVTSPNHDLNPRRVERYLAAIWEGGATPLLVLNKCDLADREGQLDDALAALAAIAQGVEAVPVSALDGRGVATLRQRVEPGRTAALVGSSGVGKSTLVNALVGVDLLATGEIRVADSKGRHTTTRRELLRLPGGGLLIDTPGLRAIEPWDAEEGLAAVYEDVEAAAQRCRFRDCEHQGEPGCAVAEALASGALDRARVEAWARTAREAAFQARKRDRALASAERKRWKQITRSVRDRPNRRT